MVDTGILYGPYYRSSRRAKETQRKALGYESMTPEAISAERYGELVAYAGEARSRRQELKAEEMAEKQYGLAEKTAERNYELSRQTQGLQARELRHKAEAEKIAGITGLGTLGILGLTAAPKAMEGATKLYESIFKPTYDYGEKVLSSLFETAPVIEDVNVLGELTSVDLADINEWAWW